MATWNLAYVLIHRAVASAEVVMIECDPIWEIDHSLDPRFTLPVLPFPRRLPFGVDLSARDVFSWLDCMSDLLVRVSLFM